MPQRMTFEDARLPVPDEPIIPWIQGDGIGPEVWAATRQVVDAALRAT